MDFREVTAALQGAILQSHSVDLALGRVELVPSPAEGPSAPALPVVFENVTLLKWDGLPGRVMAIRVFSIGLERLGAGEPWRLYLHCENAGELELTCERVVCGGSEVTGVGRSYRH
jgi:hypothetical protein